MSQDAKILSSIGIWSAVVGAVGVPLGLGQIIGSGKPLSFSICIYGVIRIWFDGEMAAQCSGQRNAASTQLLIKPDGMSITPDTKRK